VLPVDSPDSPRRSIIPAVLIGLSAAFLFCGYEFIRSTANTLFKQAYGKEGLPYVMAVMPLGVLLMLYGYGRCLSRFGPRRTLLITSLLSAAAIFACYALIQAEINIARAVLYIVREAYVVLITEQLWSFLNSRLNVAHARALNGPICGLGSIGGIAGATAVVAYSKTLGTTTMLVFGAAAILPALGFALLAYRYCGEPLPEAHAPASARSDTLGVRLFTRERMLFFLLLIVIATQVISSVTDLAYQGALQDAYPDANEQNAVSGRFYFWLNVFSAVGQFLIAPLLLWLAPLWLALAMLPVVNVGACLYAWSVPSLFSFGLAHQAFKVIDYSVFRAAKEPLYIPLSFDARFRAKELIDVWGYRFSKGATATLIALFAALGWIVQSASLFSAVAVAAAGVWLALTPFLIRARSKEEGGLTNSTSS